MRAKRAVYCRRCIGAILFIFVLFVPLHIHFYTVTPQVSKECGCYHGGRTQAGLAPASQDSSPTFQLSSLVTYEPRLPVWFSVESPTIRAPPSN